MKRWALAAFACPSCRRSYALTVGDEDESGVQTGRLTCEGCGIMAPILKGFPLFTEASLTPPADDQATRLFGDRAAYDAYRRQKDERDLWESYAAFHPFNESFRSIEPLVDTLRAHLSPGDLILDVWARTGWSGEWLAGQFPEQRVISLWEGDSSVLGYRGFAYWLGSGRCAPNLDIAFVPPNRPLPFAGEAFGAVYAYDVLHRYDLYPFAGECLRVGRKDGAILFSHLHLSNNEPDPFFERGCRQDHGRDYRAWLDRVLTADGRKGWVLSEADLFEGRPIADTPDTSHYNGAVLIARAEAPATGAVPRDHDRFLVNPLLRLDFGRSAVSIDEALRDGDVGRHLSRHPIYRARLPAGRRAMSAQDWLALVLAVAGATRSDIARSGAGEALAGLAADEILAPAPVGERALAMQRFHANQLPVDSPAVLLDKALTSGGGLGLPDGSAIAGEELAQTVSALAALLPGALTLSATKAPLAFLAFLAAIAGSRDVKLAPGADDDADLQRLAERLAQPLAGTITAPLLSAEPSGTITLPGGAAVSAATLIEAAASLRHAVRPDLSGVAEFGGINTLMLCLIALMRGEAVVFGGAARPAP